MGPTSIEKAQALEVIEHLMKIYGVILCGGQICVGIGGLIAHFDSTGKITRYHRDHTVVQHNLYFKHTD